MACKKLGSKSDFFHLEDGQTWICSTGLPCDVIVEVGEFSFHLHKFPLMSRSMLFEKLIQDSSQQDKECVLQLHDIPGGARAFLIVAKFCYNIKIELTAMNVITLRCAAEYLRMSEDYGERNLIAQTENFLNEVFGFWVDTMIALESCEEVLPFAEELHLVSRCIESMAAKACSDPSLLSLSSIQNPAGVALWNGIDSGFKDSKNEYLTENWWYEDVSNLKLHMYKRLIFSVTSKGMSPERIAGSVTFYAKKHLPLNGRQSNFKNVSSSALGSEAEQTNLLEEIVGLLPDQKGVIPTKFLLKLLRTSMILHASPPCQEALEKRIGSQLDDAALEDILIPNMGYSVETLYDIDCVQRIVDHFMLGDLEEADSNLNELVVDGGQLIAGSQALTPTTMVANLVDNYLSEVAPDVNLKLTKFLSLASLIPDYSRPVDDGIYRAIDIYLKAHPWLTDSEREQLCRLMNCQKLSLEASTHAAQNERLPLRVIVQVLFFEQLRLRTSVAGWFFVSENLENNSSTQDLISRRSTGPATVDDMRDRVAALEKECLDMKQEVEKLVKTKGSWSSVFKMLGLRLKSRSSDHQKVQKAVKTPLSAKMLRNSRKSGSSGKARKEDCKVDDDDHKIVQSES